MSAMGQKRTFDMDGFTGFEPNGANCLAARLAAEAGQALITLDRKSVEQRGRFGSRCAA